MFYFQCKSIFRGLPTHQLYNSLHNHKSMLFTKYISTATNLHAFTVSYLINSCGFSQESALSISERVQFKSPEKPDSVIAMFNNHCFSKLQIFDLIKREPRLLLANPEKTILPKLNFFYSVGCSKPDVALMFSLWPRILNRSLEKFIIPTFNELSNLVQSRQKAINIIKGNMRFLLEDLNINVAPKINILRSYGVPDSNIGTVLYIWPRIFKVRQSKFENVVEVVEEMGINPLKLKFVLAVGVKLKINKSLWEKKLEVYKMWDLSEEEILVVFRKYPYIMLTSEHKIMAMMDFFVEKMGWKSTIIARCPNLINLSLEKRIIPRAAVIQFLSSKGLIGREYTKMPTLFLYSVETFLQRFVNSYDEAPQLLKLYKEKLDLSKRAKSPARPDECCVSISSRVLAGVQLSKGSLHQRRRTPSLKNRKPFLSQSLIPIPMLYFFSKTIFHGLPTQPFYYFLHYHKSVLFTKCISTASNLNAFTVSYLINSCGFSQESALSISKRVQFKSPEKPDSVIAMFNNHCFSKPQILDLIKREPRLLLANPEKTILPKLNFFYSIGFLKLDVASIFSLCPRILNRSLEKFIVPTFNELSNLVQSREKAISIIKGNMRFLYEGINIIVSPKIDILRSYGVPDSNIRTLLYIWPRVFNERTSGFKKAVEDVEEMGLNPLKSHFVSAVGVKLKISKSLWEKKLKLYKMWDFSEEEILVAFRKYPLIMLTSEHKIMAVMDFFVKKMGWESAIIARRPTLINLSLEKRIIPRAAVIQFLSSKGLIGRKYTKMPTLFLYSEETFLQRFVNSYDEAPQLLKLYKEKLDLSK
ncbi:uncharacterized protein LOC123221555 [Mangifera indica]|uniref:uncharacterized protein LOC123221555 n=1 Tax=Mangifera indica TaxID=29780 RepID=UPI001CF9C016|nr:uncharacterized protein LOC123221555 [Mangifera indica]